MADSDFARPYKIYGRHIMGLEPRMCMQQVSVVEKNETLHGAQNYIKDISVAPWSAEMMIVRSQIGAFTYDRSKASEVADLLVKIAGQIRRNGR